MTRKTTPILFVLATTVALNSWASTVRQVSVTELLARSNFIFDGIVVAKESIQPDGTDMVFTRVRFAVFEVLKGDPVTSVVSLDFAGGTINGRTLAVSGVRIPKSGERGIYFVESLDRRLVNPLYGWDQGRFLILSDQNGRTGVYTAAGSPVQQLEPVEQTAVALNGGVTGGAGAVALGVQVSDRNAADNLSNQLTPDVFKQQLREIGRQR